MGTGDGANNQKWRPGISLLQVFTFGTRKRCCYAQALWKSNIEHVSCLLENIFLVPLSFIVSSLLSLFIKSKSK